MFVRAGLIIGMFACGGLIIARSLLASFTSISTSNQGLHLFYPWPRNEVVVHRHEVLKTKLERVNRTGRSIIVVVCASGKYQSAPMDQATAEQIYSEIVNSVK
jgi:hypothetical protein